MKKDKKPITPFAEFIEKVARPVVNCNGRNKDIKEYVAVVQLYNAHGIKIRKQCSSCEKYKRLKASGSLTYTYCPNSLKQLTPTMTVPDGRWLCKEYEMAEWCVQAGKLRSNASNVLTRKYIRWYCDNYLRLLSEFQPVSMTAVWSEWLHYKFESEYGEDIYGRKLHND